MRAGRAGGDESTRPRVNRPTADSPLADWLGYLETLHPKSIAMGLDRVASVAARLDVRPGCPVITVTGTNGKGSVCAYLDSILRAAGRDVPVTIHDRGAQ